jgi:hypothetical protein
MKKIASFIFVLLVGMNGFSQTTVYSGNIQIAILFDTSNSMDGLIEQAKSRIWAIVNTMSNLKYNGQTPTIEIALYDYGNDNILENKNFVRQIIPFTSDLDLISQKLFGLTTRGGSEYCGAVISESIEKLSWKNNPNDMKMIYIAGNEPFNQGAMDYKIACTSAKNSNIRVNTIYCGDYQQGIKEFWYDGAQIGSGEYSNINSNLVVKHYDTPFDERIRSYNDSLNRTYYGYGAKGSDKKSSQEKEDKNAVTQSAAAFTERAIVKSKAVYNNASWDIIDACKTDSTQVLKIKEEDLPQELKGKNEEEKMKFVSENKTKREKYQKLIQDLNTEREKHIAELRKNENSNESDFGAEIEKSVMKNAESLGYEKK